MTAATLHKLARGHLGGCAGVSFPPKTRGARMRAALESVGYGLEHLVGEHVVACVEVGEGEGGFGGVIVTDRALIFAEGDARRVVGWGEVTGASVEEGWLQTTFALETRSGALEVPLGGEAKAVASLVRAAVEAGYAPQARRAPLLTCSPADPSGLEHLVGSIQQPAPEVVALLEGARRRLEAGAPAEEVRWLLARVALHHRSLAFGRGAWEGRWLSPLEGAALEAAWAGLLPAGAQRVTLQGGAVALEARWGDAGEDEDAPAGRGGLQARLDGAKAALQERLTEAVVESVVDRLSRKVLGEDLATFLGEEATGLRVILRRGPALPDVIEGEETLSAPAPEATSAWARLKSGFAELTQALHASPLPPALGAYEVEARVGRRWRPLAEGDRSRLAQLHAGLRAEEGRVTPPGA